MFMQKIQAMVCLAVVLGLSCAVQAASWDESGDGGGDAGQNLSTAQAPAGSGALSSISGAIAGRNDVDLYKIHVSNPGSFSATTLGGADFDTQLFLFTATGHGVEANDDWGRTLQSSLAGSCRLPVGCYYLAVSTFDNDPQNAHNQRMFPNFLPNFIVPAWPFIGTLDHWSNTGSTCACGFPKDYTVKLTGAGFCDPAMPEPASLALLGIGLGMIGLARRRKVA